MNGWTEEMFWYSFDAMKIKMKMNMREEESAIEHMHTHTNLFLRTEKF